jgi:hypothetical protein
MNVEAASIIVQAARLWRKDSMIKGFSLSCWNIAGSHQSPQVIAKMLGDRQEAVKNLESLSQDTAQVR